MPLQCFATSQKKVGQNNKALALMCCEEKCAGPVYSMPNKEEKYLMRSLCKEVCPKDVSVSLEC